MKNVNPQARPHVDDVNNPLSCVVCLQVQWVTGVANDRHLSVSVNAPSGLLVSTVDDAKGQINFLAEETGVCVCVCPSVTLLHLYSFTSCE